MADHGMCDIVARGAARGKLVRAKWLDDWGKHGMRSRLKRDDVTQNTPPLVAARLLVSKASSFGHKVGAEARCLAGWDCSVAFYHAPLDEDIVVIPSKKVVGPAWRPSSLHTNVMVLSVVVQVSAILFSPSVGLLRISILLILLPPDYDGALIVFPCSSSGIYCFPMVLLPLSLAVLLAPWAIHSFKVTRRLSKLGIWLRSLLLFLHQVEDRRHKNRKSILPVSASSMNGTGRFCEPVPTRTTQMLPISWITGLDSSLNFTEFSGFPRSLRIDFVREPFLDFSNLSWIFPIRSSSFKITFCAIPSSLRSTLNSGSSFSTSDSVLRSSFLALGSSGLSVGLPCSSLCTICSSFLVREDALSEVSCCCCFDCQALFSTIFGAGRGVESLPNKVRSHFWEITLQMQSAGTELCTITAWDLVCQNRNPLSCAQAKLIQQGASWAFVHLLWQCTFLGVDRSSLGSSRLDCPRTGCEVWRRWFVFLLCLLVLQRWVLVWGLKWH